MRIGIVNVQWFDNPGAVWLSYSLQESVKKIFPNADIEIIDYAVGGAKENQGLFVKVLKKIKVFSDKIYHFFIIQDSVYKEQLIQRHKNYECFRRNYLQRTERFTDLNSDILPPKYDVCIVGSDVVWKPEIAESRHSKIYFLQFADADTKKISYAASIGTDDLKILNPLRDTYRDLIKNFDSISLREQTAVEYLETLSKVPVIQVLDPVFLLKKEEYESLLNETPPVMCKEKYLYLYMLSFSKEMVECSLKIAKINHLKIVYDLHTDQNLILKKYLGEHGIPSIDAGPLEFLNCIKNAELIISNSFHGTAFSIIFHKDFYTFGKKNAGVDISTRMVDLLEKLNLLDRYCKTSEVLVFKSIDYRAVDEKLMKLKKESIDFLEESLR